MIIQGNNHAIERSGGINENKFTIEANGKAFRVLADGLYPDKPKAILRELCCNAYDAHVAAGKADQPFDVHLPTSLEPWLTIRDYGIGLTPEEIGGYYKDVTLANGTTEKVYVGGIYNTFFKSTKTNSNDYIGALGLGSKSPFSYVDSFTVISRKDGMKYSFTAYYNENDEPEIVELGREPTDEGNGLEVSMPVKQQDFGQFAEKARDVLQWFKPLPNVTGRKDFNVTQLEEKASGTGWYMVEYSHYRRAAVAIQGKVAYPIDVYSLQHKASREQLMVLGGPFVIQFDIGSLDVTASRETLSYKGPTIDNLLLAADRVLTELPAQLQKAFDDCQSMWEARHKFREITHNNNFIYELLSTGKIALEWNGNKLTTNDNYFSVESTKFPNIVFTSFNYRTSKTALSSLATTKRAFTLSVEQGVKVFRDDIKRGGYTRVRTHHKDRGYHAGPTYLVQGPEDEVTKFLAALGDPPVVMTSTLPTPVRTRVKRSSVQELYVNDYTYKVAGTDIDTEDFDVDEEEGLYVHIARGLPQLGEASDGNFGQIYHKAIELGILKKNEKVYGVTKASLAEFQSRDTWKNFRDEIKERFEKYLKTNKLGDKLGMKQSYSNWENYHYSHTHLIHQVVRYNNGCLPDDHPILEMSRQREAVRTIDVSKVQALAGLLNVAVDATTNAYNFVNVWADLVKKYPMLRFVTPHLADDVKATLEYIKLIDNSLATVAK